MQLLIKKKKEAPSANMLLIIVLCNALYCDDVLLFACHVFVFYNSPQLAGTMIHPPVFGYIITMKPGLIIHSVRVEV